ncbi:hypothetical protein JCM15519_33710 [Fundidesulfovibrio butyratiphilus]
MKRRVVLLVLVVLCFVSSPAFAQVACMVSSLDGKAALVRNGGQPVGLSTFKKLLPGDQVDLPQGSSLRLSYLAQGKAETWSGPARLVIEPERAQDTLGKKKPQVVKLGTDASLLKDSPMLRDQKELVAGQITVRGSMGVTPENAPLDASQRNQLLKAEAEYRRLVKTLPPTDATPYLFYLASLDRLGQKATMAEVLQNLLDKDGANRELAAMLKGLYAPGR